MTEPKKKGSRRLPFSNNPTEKVDNNFTKFDTFFDDDGGRHELARSPSMDGSFGRRKKARNAKSMVLPQNVLSMNPFLPNPGPPPIPVTLSQTTKAPIRREGPKEIRDFFLNILNDIFRAVGLQENTIKEIVLHFDQGLHTAEEGGISWLRRKSRAILEAMVKKIESFLERQREQEKYVTVQSLCRRWLTRKRLNLKHNTFERLSKRNQFYFQTLKGERDYNKKLILLRTIQKELRRNKIISPVETSALFSNIDSLCILHEELLMHLERLQLKWPLVTGIARAFLSIGDALQLYGQYADDFQFALQTLKDLQERKPRVWASFLELATSFGLSPNEDFAHLLYQPLARIKEYELLFEEQLADYGSDPNQQTEQADVIAAHGLVQQWSDLLRKRVELSHVRASVQRIQNQLLPVGSMNLLVAGRSIYREGAVNSAKKGKKYHLVLFTDLLLVTKPTGQDKLLIVGFADLSQVEVLFNPTPSDLRASISLAQFDVKTPSQTFSFFDSPSWAQDITDLSRKKRNKVFGVPLLEVLEAEDRVSLGVPIVVETLVTWLRKNQADKAEGILRISGSSSKTAALKSHVDKKIPPELIGSFIPDSLCDTPHDVAVILKNYFKELPEPLLTFNLYDELLTIMKSTDLKPLDRLRLLKEMISTRIPTEYVKLLRYLIEYLHEVAAQSSINLMNAHNLAIVFTPNLIRPKEATLESAMNAPHLLGIVEMMLEYKEHLFYDGPFPSMETSPQLLERSKGSSNRSSGSKGTPSKRRHTKRHSNTNSTGTGEQTGENYISTAEKTKIRGRVRVVSFDGSGTHTPYGDKTTDKTTDNPISTSGTRAARSSTQVNLTPQLRSILKLSAPENLREITPVCNEPLLSRRLSSTLTSIEEAIDENSPQKKPHFNNHRGGDNDGNNERKINNEEDDLVSILALKEVEPVTPSSPLVLSKIPYSSSTSSSPSSSADLSRSELMEPIFDNSPRDKILKSSPIGIVRAEPETPPQTELSPVMDNNIIDTFPPTYSHSFGSPPKAGKYVGTVVEKFSPSQQSPLLPSLHTPSLQSQGRLHSSSAFYIPGSSSPSSPRSPGSSPIGSSPVAGRGRATLGSSNLSPQIQSVVQRFPPGTKPPGQSL